MRSLDTLLPARPKTEAGRAPAGEEAGAQAAPGFEAMLGSFEGAPSSAGASSEAQEPATPASDEAQADRATAPPAPALDAANSALQTLIALAGPGAPIPAPTPEAGLAAMVQRAAARGGTTVLAGSEAAAPPVSVLGLETHFAPVRPGAPLAEAFRMAEAGPTSIAAGTRAAQPAATEPPVPSKDLSLASLVGTEARGTAPTGLAPAPQPPTRTPSAPPESPLPLPDAARIEAGSTGIADRPAALARAPEADEPQRKAASTVPQVSDPAQSDPSDSTVAPTKAAPIPAASLGAARTAAPRPPAAIRPDDRDTDADPVAETASDPSPSQAQPSARASDPAPVARATAQAPRAPEAGTERPVEIVRAAGDDARLGTEPAAAEPRGLDVPAADPAASGPGMAPMPVTPSPQRQIVDAIASQLPAAASPVQGRPVTGPAEAGPLRILTLQLHPADLGSVLVRMRLQDGRLDMSLRTSREETAERLRHDSDLLSGLLREAGYEPETLTIQAGGGPGEPGSRGPGASFAGSPGGQNDRQPGAATPDQSGRRPSPRADAAAMPTEEQDHETDSGSRDRGSLYL